MTICAMYGYRVTFKNNIPQSAMRIEEIDRKHIVHLSTIGEQRYMDWLVVPGDDERDAIDIANELMQTIWMNYLRKRK